MQVLRPQTRMHCEVLYALAGLPKPLHAMLMLYALGDAQQWWTVLSFARVCLPKAQDSDIAEGMLRLLTEPAKGERAGQIGMRRHDWERRSQPALMLFESWLQRASEHVMNRMA